MLLSNAIIQFTRSGLFRTQSRCFPSTIPLIQRFASSKALFYKTYGEPGDVLECDERPMNEPGDDELLIKMCAAPIHPSDINTIQGVYPIKPELPAVGGNEGVGRVITCGSRVDEFAVGDLVIPIKLSSGTWQTHVCDKASNFYRIPHFMPASHAAVFRGNPGTALRMLRDFVDLRPNDVLIQNGATSAVGIYVIQLASMFGVKTINLFRPRETDEGTEVTRSLLQDYGATWALTDIELADKENAMVKEIKKAGPVRLALNCLGGRPAVALMKALAESGTLVSYGAMTRNPMTVPVGPLIFRDIRLCGFWMSAWLRREHPSRRNLMWNHLSEYFCHGKLRPSPFEEVAFEDWRRGIAMSLFDNSNPTGVRNKVILKMD